MSLYEGWVLGKSSIEFYPKPTDDDLDYIIGISYDVDEVLSVWRYALAEDMEQESVIPLTDYFEDYTNPTQEESDLFCLELGCSYQVVKHLSEIRLRGVWDEE